MAAHALLTSGAKTWRSVACPKAELRLDLTLACGQSFRWRETADGHWTGVMGGRVWTLTQTDNTLWYHVYKKPGDRKPKAAAAALQQGGGEEEEAVLRDYFQLNVKLHDLYKQWGAADPHFQRIAGTFTGIRMLRQDPTECLFSFICTSNNHISRIHGMVERLCEALGDPLLKLDQTAYHDFPSLSALADTGVEARLRDLGFGYRARFVHQSARQIVEEHGLSWLEGLRGVPYPQARDALRTLPGVGTKVADCVCLMSLDKAEAVPVDTHVWQIAKRDYKYAAGKEQKSITERLHKDIGDFFRNLWGPHAGWAQSVLFCADLKKFQKLKEERPQLKRPKKEEDEERPVAYAETAVKAEPNGAKKRNRKHRKEVKEEKVD